MGVNLYQKAPMTVKVLVLHQKLLKQNQKSKKSHTSKRIQVTAGIHNLQIGKVTVLTLSLLRKRDF